MLSWMIAASVGISCVIYFPALPPLTISLFALPLIVLAFFYRSTLFRWCVAGVLGILWGVVYGHRVMHSLLPFEFESRPLWVTGVVVGLPEVFVLQGRGEAQTGQRFNLRVTGKVCLAQASSSVTCFEGLKNVRLAWYGQTTLLPGQQWRLLVKLKRPHSMANPGGFNVQTWSIQRAIGAQGYVRKTQENTHWADTQWSIDRLRYQGATALEQALAGKQYLPLFKALLLGDKRDISQTQWDLFSRTGTTHLMVISGLHIGLMSALAFVLTRLIVTLLIHRGCSERIAAVSAIVVAVVYSLAAGFSLPTQRALVMISVAMLAIILRRESSASQGMVTALFICLVFDPLAPVSASFWLSFCAVAVLFYGSVGRRCAPVSSLEYSRKVCEFFWRPQYLIFIGLFPALFILIKQFSVLTPIANFIAVPLFSVMIVPGVLLASFFMLIHNPTAMIIWDLLDSTLAYLLIFLRWLDTQGQATQLHAIIPGSGEKLWYFTLVVAGMLLVLSPKGIPLRHWGWVMMLPIVMYKPKPIEVAELQVNVLDVGQGLAIVVHTKLHTLVYDVGVAYGEHFSIVRSVMLPFLQSQGITTVDRLVLSHGDNDHAGGWRVLTDALPVKQVHYGQWLDGFEKTQAYSCRAGYRWHWDGVIFEYLHPASPGINEKIAKSSSNNNSCVLKISTPGASFLLTGDIERDVERLLSDKLGERLRAKVLIAPHHGSATSSSWPFIRSVNPEHVVISSGYRNQFGHPKEQIVKRYLQLNATVHRTSVQGAIGFQVKKGQLLAVSHYRERYQHYWM
ncbi:MAG: DNA internalization-related competence protein ComEC/Rec2 [Spongiibacteraceae bacterium]|nr:DNA internalization-related competence protein ComEC/Rec2 [Spongiibacteraceae bacterium]